MACTRSPALSAAAFLRATHGLVVVASTLHQDTPVPGTHLSELCAAVSRAVADLAGPAPATPVGDACRRIAGDVLIRVGRIEHLALGERVDVDAFCKAWARDDVGALGERVAELAQRWRGAFADQEHGDLLPNVTTGLPKKTLDNPEADDPPEKPRQDLATYSSLPLRPRLVSPGIIADFILDSLAYTSMHDRADQVPPAHASTFAWIVGPAHPFTTWLATPSLGPVYWITGKPGSGKSTLTHFLASHPETARLLTLWAGGDVLATAGFFFWTSGSREQRSQRGMLRSLLWQLLGKYPERMGVAFPALWGRLRGMSTKERVSMRMKWDDIGALKGALRGLLGSAGGMRVCLFIDWLDELDGDHVDMVHFLRGLAGPGVKMCLSSRPWEVFDRAFEGSVPNLKLQELTQGDMLRYARDRLPQRSDATVQEVVRRADGVFLWVRLAIDQLLIDPDVLDTLPTELDDLFAKLLLEDQTADEVAETAMLLALIRAREVVCDAVRDESATSLTVWEVAFALRGESDDNLAREGVVEEASDGFVAQRCEETVGEVQRRFRGLLELHGRRRDEDRGTAGKRVVFIHRTVRDWLVTNPQAQDRLLSSVPGAFDAHLRLLRSYILRLKRPLEPVEHHRRLDEWYPDIVLCMTHARHVAVDAGFVEGALLRELDAVLGWYWRAKDEDDTWVRAAFGSYEVRARAPLIRGAFLCLAVKFGLRRFVAAEVGEREAGQGVGEDGATPLLAYAIEFLTSRNKSIFPLSSPGLVLHLLRRGDPNEAYVDFNTLAPRTPWVALLRRLRDAKRRGWIVPFDIDPEGTERWAEIVGMFIQNGADVDAVLKKDGWDVAMSARGVLDMLDEAYGSVHIRALKEMI